MNLEKGLVIPEPLDYNPVATCRDMTPEQIRKKKLEELPRFQGRNIRFTFLKPLEVEDLGRFVAVTGVVAAIEPVGALQNTLMLTNVSLESTLSHEFNERLDLLPIDIDLVSYAQAVR
jgi:hypothetical protein